MIGYKKLIIGEKRIMARAVAWSPDGKKIVVGIGGRVGMRKVGTQAKHDGEIYIFKVVADPTTKSNFLLEDHMPTVLASGHTLKSHPRKWISDIKFSKQTLAVAAHDNQIYLYNAQTFTLRCKCKGHSGSVLHIDFSMDGRILQSTSNDYELLFWDVNTGKQQTRVSAFRDQEWDTFTCPLGWPVQGIWPKSADGTDINAVDLYQSDLDKQLIKNNKCNQYVGLLATVDDFGKVKLFNSPAEKSGSASIEYRGHSAHVTNVRFTNGKNQPTYLISTGGEDRAVMQWTLEVDDVNHEEEHVSQEQKDLMNPGWVARSTTETDQHRDVAYDPLDAAFEFGSAGAGDEFMAVKPWVGAIKAPTNPPPPVPNIVPETDLELKWVNGFNGFNSRNAVHYDSEGALHYPAATLNVKTCLKEKEKEKPKWPADGNKKGRYTPSQYKQMYNEDHSDDILCHAMNIAGTHGASGAMGKKPLIVVYETKSMKTVNVLSGFHKKAVSSLAFSGKLLASVGEDDCHSVAIYNWETGTLVASAKGEKNKVFSICFNEDGTRLAQCGINHIRFWDLKGRNLAPKKGLMKGHGKIQPFLSVCHLGVKDPNSDMFVFGGTTGTMYVFEGRECIGTLTDRTAEIKKYKTKKGQERILRHAHNGAINALAFYNMKHNETLGPKPIGDDKDRQVIISGGRSGWVKIWDAQPILDLRAGKKKVSTNAQTNLQLHKDNDDCACESDHPKGPRHKLGEKFQSHHRDCCRAEKGKKKCSKNCFCSLHYKPLAKFNLMGQGIALGNKDMVWQIRSLSYFHSCNDHKLAVAKLAVATRGAQIWEYNLMDKVDGKEGAGDTTYNTAEILHLVEERRKNCPVKKQIPLIQGHWKDEVWGLAMNPRTGPCVSNQKERLQFQNEHCYATVGDDNTLRVWDIQEQRVLGQAQLEGMARAVAISPDASMIAVGLGGSVGRGKDKMDGWVYIYDGATKLSGFEELEKAQTMHHAKGWISDVKFSPDGATLAVASHDNKIYVYDIYPPANSLPDNSTGAHATGETKDRGGEATTVSRNPREKDLSQNADEAMKNRSVRLRGICKGHSSYITHLDFSQDSNWLQTTCGAYELLFWDVRSPCKGGAYTKPKPQRIRQQTNATAMRDVDWATWTCTLGWPVQGIWPKCADGTDINAVDLNGSPSMNDRGNKKKKTLITADDSGKLKMFRWPCIEKGSPFSVESGHASHVTNVRWSSDTQWVISTGGNDRCVFQWKLKEEEEMDEMKHELHEGSDPEGFEGGDPFDPFAGGVGGGDEFQAVKPWKGQIATPSDPMPSNPLVPKVEPELEWIFGASFQTGRDNLRYSASGDIIYHSAAVGIVLNDSTEEGAAHSSENTNGDRNGGNYSRNPYKQRFFREHDDDITCLDVDPNGRYVATGQVQSSKSRKMKPCVKIWDAESCRPICTLGEFHKRAVSSVAFSADGKWCGSVGKDENNSVALWGSRTGQWTDGKLLTTCRGDPSPTLFIAFAGDSEGDYDFVTGGKSHMRFWNVTGHTMKSRVGKLGQNVPPTKGKSVFLTAIGLGKGYYAAGMLSGHIFIFHKNKFVTSADAHKSSSSKSGCQALHKKTLMRRGNTDMVEFVSGGSDGQIIMWEFVVGKGEPKLKEIQNSRFSVTSIVPRPKDHCIKSVCWDGSLRKILIGTRGSEAYTIKTNDNPKNRFDEPKLIFSGHYKDEVWGLAPHPLLPNVLATCGTLKFNYENMAVVFCCIFLVPCIFHVH